MHEIAGLIAQTTTAPAPGGTAAKPPQGNMFFEFLLPMGLVMIVLFWFVNRGQRKERDRHAAMLKAMKRGDRVQTIGGILATVVEVRDNEVVLKVDESTNTKMRFNRAAIKEVVSADAPPTPPTPVEKK